MSYGEMIVYVVALITVAWIVRRTFLMLLRHWFAGQAISLGVLKDVPGRDYGTPEQALAWIAEDSYRMADAMLAEKDKP